MKVYLVQYWDYDDRLSLWIFSTGDVARSHVEGKMAEARRRHQSLPQYTLDEVEVLSDLPVEKA